MVFFDVYLPSAHSAMPKGNSVEREREKDRDRKRKTERERQTEKKRQREKKTESDRQRRSRNTILYSLVTPNSFSVHWNCFPVWAVGGD